MIPAPWRVGTHAPEGHMSNDKALMENFLARVDKDEKHDGCHIWTGPKTKAGYGRLSIGDRKSVYAHRWMLGHKLGRPLSASEESLHACDKPSCVNPDHLSAGTHADNMRDMALKGRGGSRHANTTHCPQGHPYEGENLRIRKDGARGCKACGREAAERKRRVRGAPIKSPPFCPKGHEFTPANTRIKKCGSRECRECARIYERARRARKAGMK